MKNNIEIFNLHTTNNIEVHATAIIDQTADISEGVSIGAYVIIGKNVKIGKNTIILAHAIINDYSTIGEDNKIHYGAIIGSESQDLKSTNEKSYTIIGDRNIIREYATINRASNAEQKTIIGNDNLLMAYVHIAHDCVIGNRNIFSNSVNLGGHCLFGDENVIGGLSGIHQFVRVGNHSMIGGLTRVTQDIPSYFTIVGNPAKVEGVNIKGLRRNNFTREQINNLREAYNIIYSSNLPLSESLKKLEELDKNDEINHLIDFLTEKSKRGIIGLNFRNLKEYNSRS